EQEHILSQVITKKSQVTLQIRLLQRVKLALKAKLTIDRFDWPLI
ncbi:MAG: hypothetical protein US62_C0008G0043, partial [Candidatus Woesebacteria bacterium GW2011_GWA1_37_8]